MATLPAHPKRRSTASAAQDPFPGNKRSGETKTSLHVLIVEDSEDDALLMERALANGGFHVVSARVETAAELAEAMEQREWDVVLSDCALPGFSARQALEMVRERRPDRPFVVVSGTIGEEAAASLLRSGAQDYVSKANLARLAPVVGRELRDGRTRAAHRAAEERIRRLAFYDPITDLPNRNLLFTRLEAAMQRAPGRMALLVTELAGVSDARKTLGAVEAEGFLRVAAHRFKELVGQAGVVAWLGSDRFAVASPGSTEADALVLAEALVDCLRTPLIDLTSQLRATAAFGIALAPGQADTPDGLLRRAEVAAECARRSKLSTCVYTPELDIYTEHRLELLNALWQAGERNELEVVYQPKADLQDRTVGTVEALVRWNRPGRVTLFPDEFIPLAEDSGSIRQLTGWVVNETLRQCAEWRRGGLNLNVAINLPGSIIHDEEIVTWLAAQLAHHDLAASCLEVEITEGTLSRDPEAARRTLRGLRELGVYCSIDDFGSGYSSLAYLRTLPVRALKIDKSFLTGGLRDARDESIVRSAITLAHNLRLDVVAEGIEDESTLAHMRTYGCDSAQGYFIARPMPASALRAWFDVAPWTAVA